MAKATESNTKKTHETKSSFDQSNICRFFSDRWSTHTIQIQTHTKKCSSFIFADKVETRHKLNDFIVVAIVAAATTVAASYFIRRVVLRLKYLQYKMILTEITPPNGV